MKTRKSARMKARLWGLLAMATALAICVGLPLTAAFAAGTSNITADQESISIFQTKVAFGGKQWWAVGGLWSVGKPATYGIVSLLPVSSEENWNNVQYREGKCLGTVGSHDSQGNVSFSESDLEDAKQNVPDGMVVWQNYYDKGWYYYASGFTSSPMQYEKGNTTLEKKIQSIAEEMKAMPYEGQFVYGASAPHSANLTVIDNAEVLQYDVAWWLANSGYSPAGDYSYTVSPDGTYVLKRLYLTAAVRPLVSLNLTSAILLSAADDTGKAAVNVGDGFASTATPGASSTIKYTFIDTTQTLKVISVKEALNGKLTISWKDATTGGEDQYVSCVLKNESGNVLYYAKLANSKTSSAGTASLSLPDLSNGSYTLEIFSEKINDNLHSDIASDPYITSIGTHTVKVPIAVEVQEEGSDSAPAKPFELAAACGLEIPDEYKDSIKLEPSTLFVETNGADMYQTTTSITFTKWAYDNFLKNAGLSLTQTTQNGDGWTCAASKQPTSLTDTNITTYRIGADSTSQTTLDEMLFINTYAKAEIPEEKKDPELPTDETDISLPQTGDNSSIALWLALCALAAAGAFGILLQGREKKYGR